jgi:hypothetical protein
MHDVVPFALPCIPQFRYVDGNSPVPDRFQRDNRIKLLLGLVNYLHTR